MKANQKKSRDSLSDDNDSALYMDDDEEDEYSRNKMIDEIKEKLKCLMVRTKSSMLTQVSKTII